MRVNELDSVRGIAAFVVVLHHCWETLLPDQNTFPFLGRAAAGSGWFADLALWISLSPFKLLFSGHAAVAVFFVLSGFVLAKSLAPPRRMKYGAYVVRRFFRIYPPFFVVILASAGLCYLLRPQPIPGRDWLNLTWSEPLTFQLVAAHLSMLWSAGAYNSLNSPMWTLVHELRISLVFPLLAAFVLLRPRTALAAALAVFAALSVRHFTSVILSLLPAGSVREVLASFIETARYILFFVLGILLAAKYAAIAAFLKRHERHTGLLWIASGVLLAVPYLAAYLELCFAIGAFLLIALCLRSERAQRALRHDSLAWLGRVSYSLYLSHQVLLIAMAHLLYESLPMAVILAIFVPASLLLAEIVNRLVELPSNAVGKRLASAFARTAAAGSSAPGSRNT